MTPKEHAERANKYADPKCKVCYGRGWLRFIEKSQTLGDYCPCALRNMKIEQEELKHGKKV